MSAPRFTAVVTQAPHASRYNGGEAADARQYYARPTQHTPNGPRISAAVAGMEPGEFRTIWADNSGGIFSVRSPVTGTYGILDWNPRAAWDAATEQIIVGGLRIMRKLIAYSDITGEWRQLPMPLPMGRETGTGHWYGYTVADSSGGVYLRSYRFNPANETYATIPAVPVTTNGSNGTMYAWAPDAFGEDAGGLIRYGGDAKRYWLYNPATNTWPLYVSSLGHGQHALIEHLPSAGLSLLLGGTASGTRVSIVTLDGTATQLADIPNSGQISMTGDCWIVAHPAGCWLVRTHNDYTPKVYAVWPNEDLDDVIWEDLGTPPDTALDDPTVAWDDARGLVYLVATSGLYAWKPPELGAPSGGSSAVVEVSAAGAGHAAETASGGAAAVVEVEAQGAGAAAEDAAGGSAAEVEVSAAGAGTADEAASGGASTVVEVSAVGAGEGEESASGGSSAVVEVDASGAGVASGSAAGGSSAVVEVSAAGAGAAQELAEGGAAALVEVSATGAGTAAESADGGSSAVVEVSAAGAGVEGGNAAGGSASLVAVAAVGAGVGAEYAEGGAAALVEVQAVGAGTSTGGGGTGATAAQIWGYVMSNGQTAEANLLALLDGCTQLRKILVNKQITDPGAGTLTVYDDDSITPLLSGLLFEDAAGAQPYRGQGAERREKLE